MFEFVGQYINKQKALAKYDTVARESLENGSLDNLSKSKLDQLVKDSNLNDNDLLSHKRKAFQYLFSLYAEKQIISSSDKDKLQDVLKYFNITNEQAGLDQEAFNKYYALGEIQEGELPEPDVPDLKVILKANEIVRWASSAALMKHKLITQRINYSGPVASIRIMKGLRYRVGSIKFSSVKKDTLIAEDFGLFWVSNQRVGFQGNRKDFVIPLNKILFFDLTEDGLVVAKEGRDNPYLIKMIDYEVTCSVLSYLINK